MCVCGDNLNDEPDEIRQYQRSEEGTGLTKPINITHIPPQKAFEKFRHYELLWEVNVTQLDRQNCVEEAGVVRQHSLLAPKAIKVLPVALYRYLRKVS